MAEPVHTKHPGQIMRLVSQMVWVHAQFVDDGVCLPLGHLAQSAVPSWRDVLRYALQTLRANHLDVAGSTQEPAYDSLLCDLVAYEEGSPMSLWVATRLIETGLSADVTDRHGVHFLDRLLEWSSALNTAEGSGLLESIVRLEPQVSVSLTWLHRYVAGLNVQCVEGLPWAIRLARASSAIDHRGNHVGHWAAQRCARLEADKPGIFGQVIQLLRQEGVDITARNRDGHHMVDVLPSPYREKYEPMILEARLDSSPGAGRAANRAARPDHRTDNPWVTSYGAECVL